MVGVGGEVIGWDLALGSKLDEVMTADGQGGRLCALVQTQKALLLSSSSSAVLVRVSGDVSTLLAVLQSWFQLKTIVGRVEGMGRYRDAVYLVRTFDCLSLLTLVKLIDTDTDTS